MCMYQWSQKLSVTQVLLMIKQSNLFIEAIACTCYIHYTVQHSVHNRNSQGSLIAPHFITSSWNT